MSDKIYEIDLKAVEQLAEIVEQKKLDEITITDGEKSITIKGKKCPPPPHHHPPHPGEMPPPPPMNNGMPSQWGTGAPNGQPPETTPQPTPSAREPTATGKVRSAAVCTGGRSGEERRRGTDYRVHEADERGDQRRGWRRRRDSREKRRCRRV